jgi:hypothetical protein
MRAENSLGLGIKYQAQCDIKILSLLTVHPPRTQLITFKRTPRILPCGFHSSCLNRQKLLLVYTTQSPRRPGLYPVRTILARPLLDPVYILGMFSATTDALPSVCIEECLFLAAKDTEETHCYQIDISEAVGMQHLIQLS